MSSTEGAVFIPEILKEPALLFIVGPNGAGKSTFVENYLRESISLPFVNADEIARILHPNNPNLVAEQALHAANSIRSELLERRISFITETVFSHPSRLEVIHQANAAGYRTYFFYIGLDSPQLAQMRINERVSAGGHSIPPEKIAPRYQRSLQLAGQAIELSSYAWVLDNSKRGRNYSLLASLRKGQLLAYKEQLPKWAKDKLLVPFFQRNPAAIQASKLNLSQISSLISSHIQTSGINLEKEREELKKIHDQTITRR